MTQMIRTYSNLIKLPTFEERYKYLRIPGEVGIATFGFQRPLNQALYSSREWKDIRRKVILRDNGCDLGIAGRELNKYALVHHLNPITEEDIIEKNPIIFDMENLICVSKRTHNAIHFGDESILLPDYVPRRPRDTWP